MYPCENQTRVKRWEIRAKKLIRKEIEKWSFPYEYFLQLKIMKGDEMK